VKMTRPAVLFVCVKNGGKSQMAAGLMRASAGDASTVHSAGPRPGDAVNALAAAALAEWGIDISDEVPKPLDPQIVREVDVLVVLGGRHTSTRSPIRGSNAGTPMSPRNAVSTGSNACA